MPIDPASAAGLVLAIPGIIDLCVKYAESVSQKIEATRHSDHQIDFRKLKIKSKLEDVNYYMDACTKLAPDEIKRFNFEIEELKLSLDALKTTLELIDRRPSGLRWALVDKRRVEKFLDNVKDAHTSFHAKLKLVLVERLAFSSPQSNLPIGDNFGEVASIPPLNHCDGYEITPASVFIKSIERRNDHAPARTIPSHIESTLDDASLLPGSLIKTLPIDGGGFYIIEDRGYEDLEPVHIGSMIARMDAVATTLQPKDPADQQWMSEHTRIAHCVGFSSNDKTKVLRLLFRTNERTKTVHSLRALLLRPKQGGPRITYTLNEKIELAKTIATAVLYTHHYRYVHKNIRPSTILCVTEFKNGETLDSSSASAIGQSSYPSELGRALLVGYSDARGFGAGTERLGPQHVGGEIYVHRTRGHGDKRLNTRHTFLHDVYSLGVCLLEIGLWDSFLVSDDGVAGNWVLNVDSFAFLKRKKGVSKQDFLKEVQINFEELARYHLPRRMGQSYTDTVLECLTGLEDREEENSEDNAEGESGRAALQDDVKLGWNYIDRVINRLSSISL